MPLDVTPIFAEYFARNRGPDPADPSRRQVTKYGVSAWLDGAIIELRLTFFRGRAYCCYEAGCHLALTDGKRWQGLRQALSEHGIPAPPRLELRMEAIVEDGAIFFDLFKPDPARRGWYEFAPVDGHTYVHTATEGPDTGALVASANRD